MLQSAIASSAKTGKPYATWVAYKFIRRKLYRINEECEFPLRYGAAMPRVRLSLLTLLFTALACNSPGAAFEEQATPAPRAIRASPTVTSRPRPTESPTPMHPSSPLPPTPTATSEPRGLFRVAILADTSSVPVVGALAERALREQLVELHIEAHLDDPPNGIVFYTWGTDDSATIYGGYSS
jgi:hypothetical protein